MNDNHKRPAVDFNTARENRRAAARTFTVTYPFWCMLVFLAFMFGNFSGETGALLLLSIPVGLFAAVFGAFYGGLMDGSAANRPTKTEHPRGPLPHERDRHGRPTYL